MADLEKRQWRLRESNDNMILVRDIEVYSVCEHHMLPSLGEAHVAYISKGKIVGLSKIPRVVDGYACRLQIQERLADEVADALTRVLQIASFPETSRMSFSDSFMGELDRINGLILVEHNVHRTS
jgi:GTP cyclohydrolase I